MEAAQSGWGGNLRRLRGERGLTQAQLAHRSGVEQAVISKLETGAKDDAMHSTVQRLADALGVSVDALTGRRAAVPAEEVTEAMEQMYRLLERVVPQRRAGQTHRDEGRPAGDGTRNRQSGEQAGARTSPRWRPGHGARAVPA